MIASWAVKYFLLFGVNFLLQLCFEYAAGITLAESVFLKNNKGIESSQ